MNVMSKQIMSYMVIST